MNILDNMDYSNPGSEIRQNKAIACPECGSTEITRIELDKIGLESTEDFLRIINGALPMIKRSDKNLLKCTDCGRKWKS